MKVRPTMRKRTRLLFPAAAAVLVIGLATHPSQPPQASVPVLFPHLALSGQDRILILAPHPDDEVIGCAGIIQKAAARGLPLRIVFLTYGDANELSFTVYSRHPVIKRCAIRRMAEVRRREAIHAATILGIARTNLIFLGYPDMGTMKIWLEHWNRKPYYSLFTRAAVVPYQNAFRAGAPYDGNSVLSDLKNILGDFKPTMICLPHPADHNPDHEALYLFTRVALWDLAEKPEPHLLLYLVHFPHWPQPRGYHPELGLAPPAELVQASAWCSEPLSTQEESAKHRALIAHRTQMAYGGAYLSSFIRRNEFFAHCPDALDITTARAALADGGERASIPKEIGQQQRAHFVGLEQRTIAVTGDTLIIRIRFSRPLSDATRATVNVFGYRRDVPFAEMPKLRIKLGALTCRLFDQRTPLPHRSITVGRTSRGVTMQIPLTLLGKPEQILTNARTYLGDIPLDMGTWRIIRTIPHR